MVFLFFCFVICCSEERDLRAIVGADGIVLLYLTRGEPDLLRGGLEVVVLAVHLQGIHRVLVLLFLERVGRGGIGALAALLAWRGLCGLRLGLCGLRLGGLLLGLDRL